jgi:Tfp pilus assembly protein PilO
MNLQVGQIDRKSIVWLVIGLVVIVILRWGVYGDHATAGVTTTETVPMAEKRLQKLREIKATVPGREELLKQATAELAIREKGILQAPTQAQADAQLLETLNNLARNNGITTQGGEFRDRPLTKDYGEISVTVSFNCDIAQLINLMAALADHPQILATNELRLNDGNDRKNKTLRAMLTVSSVVPRKLLPDKKGGTLF